MSPGKSYADLLDKFARAGAILAAVLGVAVLTGWIFNIALLKSVLPHLATMKVNTAIGFLAAGVSLWLLHTGVLGSPKFHLARALAVFVLLLGSITLAEDVFRLDLGIDQILLRDDFIPFDTLYPGRMSPVTALNFLFVGLALISLKARRYGVAVCAHWLVAPPLFMSTLAIAGYAYGVNSLYQVGIFTSMALHTAVAFFVLVVSILFANLKFGFARVATSDTVGGLMTRWLLPSIPFTLFVFGWIRLKGEEAGYYGFHFGLALMVLFSIAVCVIAIAWTAIILHRIDITRLKAEAEIKDLNVGLEQRVRERTEQLAKLAEELGAANKSLEQLSLHDGLTGLANRRFFDRYLFNQIAIARRHKRRLALVLCDIDCFKAYNDRYGHPAGDDCLKRVAIAIRSCCRRPSEMVARYGGEEVAIILPDTDMDGALRIAEAVRQAVAQLNIPHEDSDTAPMVTISGGLAIVLRHTEDAEELIAAADQALYQAKHQGRNRMVCAPDAVAYIPLDVKTLRNMA